MKLKNVTHFFVIFNILVCTSFMPYVSALMGENGNIAGDAESSDIILRSKLNNVQPAHANSPTAETHTVCAALSCDYQLIQDAIGGASSGDTLDLSDETYTEIIDITKNITILGEGSELTIIQAAGDGTSATERVIDINIGVNVTIEGVTIRYGNGGWGGGIRSQGNLTITHSIVISNTANDYGGGIYNLASSMGTSATLNIIGSTIHGNSTGIGGGGIYNLGNYGEAIVNLSDSTVSGNTAGSSGGGIYNHGRDGTATIKLVRTAVNGNSSLPFGGGGISNFADNGGADADLDIIDSTVDNNSASHGGGIYVQSGGGSIHVNLDKSTISNNEATVNGGGIYGYALSGDCSITLTNVTISGNSAISGGGVYHWGGASGTANLNIIASTISTNTASFLYGGVYNTVVVGGSGSAAITMTHSILGNNTGGDCHNNAGAVFNNNEYNIIESDTGSCGTSFFAGDPGLGPLQDNGGPTYTHALLEGSQAIDAIPQTSCLLTNDQRGVMRPLGYGCDIGAFEYEEYVLFLPLIYR